MEGRQRCTSETNRLTQKCNCSNYLIFPPYKHGVEILPPSGGRNFNEQAVYFTSISLRTTLNRVPLSPATIRTKYMPLGTGCPLSLSPFHRAE